jgi:hypothetical protein
MNSTLSQALSIDTPITTERMLFYVVIRLLDPKSEGSVTPTSIESHAQPDIDLNLYSNSDDLHLASATMIMMKSVIDSINTNLGKFEYLIRYPPLNSFDNPRQLESYIKISTVPSNSYAHTIPIGKIDGEGGVDPTLHLYGARNLMVADLSVLDLPDAQPELAEMYLAKRAVQIIKMMKSGNC